MRGLTVFISDLRNCSTKEQEQKRVEKEMAHIRSKFTSEAHMNGYQRKKYVWKILYMYMLGYEVDFGHMEAVNLISSPKYSEKSVGYAWCALMLREGDELLRFIINSIRSDLIGKQDNAVSLALHAICNVGGKEFSEALSGDVIKLLTGNLTKTYVRKKSALTTLRLYRKTPDLLPAAEWADKILALLDEKNIGVLTSVSSLVLGILQNGTEGWEAAAPKAARTLTRLVLNKDYSNDYLYYGIPTPWLQIKLLKMLQFYPPPEEHALKMRVTEVLQRIVAGTDVTKNVNKNNSTHAVLFEAINLVIHMGPASDQMPQACNLLGRFISIREANIRYLGLETMARLSQQQPETMEQLKKHQSTILFSLKDPDISIRRRALDLVYSMCDTTTVKETVSELLAFLATADMSIKEELVLKVAILAERFATDHMWYVDVILQLIKSAGDYVSEEIWYRVIQIITNQGDPLQKYATESVWRSILAEATPHPSLVKVAGYVLGEFGHMIADLPDSGAQRQLEVLLGLYSNSECEVRALLLNTFVKLAHSYAEIAPQVHELLTTSAAAMDQEIQQRASEYLAISHVSLGDVKNTVLEMMPHFTERESVVQKQLDKAKVGGESGPARAADKLDEDEDEEPAAPPATVGAPVAPPDLIGSISDDPALAPVPAPESAAGLLSGLDLGGVVPEPLAPAPAALSVGKDDLLGLMSGGEPTPAAAASGATDDLLGLMSGAPAPSPAPAAVPLAGGGAQGRTTAQWRALCLRNDGVLHEDANVQVGIKMEFQNHQGRLAVYVGNKTGAPMTSLATQLSPCEPLAIQSQPLANCVNPRAQVNQMLMIECTHAYGEAPQIALRFVATPAGPVQLVLPLPLPPSKFLQPLQCDAADFFRRWKLFDGKEAQQIFKLQAVPLDEALLQKVVGGMRFALLRGVDPNPSNIVASGWLATKACTPSGDAESVLLRLEVNAAAAVCRISMRSDSAELNTHLSKLIVENLGAPV